MAATRSLPLLDLPYGVTGTGGGTVDPNPEIESAPGCECGTFTGDARGESGVLVRRVHTLQEAEPQTA